MSAQRAARSLAPDRRRRPRRRRGEGALRRRGRVRSPGGAERHGHAVLVAMPTLGESGRRARPLRRYPAPFARDPRADGEDEARARLDLALTARTRNIPGRSLATRRVASPASSRRGTRPQSSRSKSGTPASIFSPISPRRPRVARPDNGRGALHHRHRGLRRLARSTGRGGRDARFRRVYGHQQPRRARRRDRLHAPPDRPRPWPRA